MLTAAWVAILGRILAHRIFVTHDSLISYAHVWWIESRLWHGHGVPWNMPVLGHGTALTFPYGSLPWLAAAVLWPVLGEWSVTLVLVVGAVLLVAATFWAAPELRRPWPAVVVLANPVLVAAPLSGQLPFLWGSALLMAGIGFWRRGRRVPATLAVGLGQLCHAAVVLPIAALIVLVWWRWEPNRRALATCYVLSLLIAVPGIYPVLASPVFVESSLAVKLQQFLGTVSVRSLVFLVPAAAVLTARWRWGTPGLAALAVVLNFALVAPLDGFYAWNALDRRVDPTLARFAGTAEFRPGATYRVLPTDGKVGMYALLRRGARLDSEFFPESIWHGDFVDARAYSEFLAARRIDFVLMPHRVSPGQGSNEGVVLATMAAHPRCTGAIAGVRLVAAHPGWDDYAIDRSCLASGRSGAGAGTTKGRIA